jgi:hypothetical protein
VGLGSGYSQEGGGLTEITHLFPEGEGALLFAIGHLFHLLQHNANNANNANGKQDATQTNRGKTETINATQHFPAIARPKATSCNGPYSVAEHG